LFTDKVDSLFRSGRKFIIIHIPYRQTNAYTRHLQVILGKPLPTFILSFYWSVSKKIIPVYTALKSAQTKSEQ